MRGAALLANYAVTGHFAADQHPGVSNTRGFFRTHLVQPAENLLAVKKGVKGYVDYLCREGS